MGAGAGCLIIGSRLEVVGVVSVKAVCNCKAGNGCGYETAVELSHCLHHGGWSVVVGGLAGDVGWVGRWNVVHFEFVPHGLFRYGGDEGVGVGTHIGLVGIHQSLYLCLGRGA